MKTASFQTILMLCLMEIFTGDHQVFCISGRRDRFSSSDVTMDLSLSSFDDQYEGCERKMENKIGQINQVEFVNNNIYSKAWKEATGEWRNKEVSTPIPSGFKPAYAIAIVAYTGTIIHRDFNKAVKTAGRRRTDYFKRFNFKAFSFLLTRALQVLKASDARCYNVYRGVGNINFKPDRQTAVRFGYFASSSLDEETAKSFAGFGKKTIFKIWTCLGVYIKRFSNFPNEEEVLIPPYEKFKVGHYEKEGDTTVIHLNSDGKYSQYNCEYVKGSQPGAEGFFLMILLASF